MMPGSHYTVIFQLVSAISIIPFVNYHLHVGMHVLQAPVLRVVDFEGFHPAWVASCTNESKIWYR